MAFMYTPRQASNLYTTSNWPNYCGSYFKHVGIKEAKYNGRICFPAKKNHDCCGLNQMQIFVLINISQINTAFH